MHDSHTPTLSDICADLFSLLVYLHKSRDLEPLDALHGQVVRLFDSMEEKARDSKIADRDIQDAKYALAAFIDETVGWESRLELEFFDSNIAGEEFFNKLEQIRETGGRNGILEIYYLCLIFGFEGKYARTPEKLQGYIKDFQQALQSKGVEKQLSPHGERPQETIRPGRSGIPSWVPWAFGAACVVVTGFVFMLLKIRMSDFAESLVNQLQNFLH